MNKDERLSKRALFLNRQPTLFRHGCPGVTVEPVDDDSDETIHLSPFILEGMNADFDGDCVLSDIILMINGVYQIMHIKDVPKHINLKFIEEKTKEKGKIVENYEVLDEVYISAINQNGDIDYRKVTNWSVHKNLKMYDISLKNKIAGSIQFEEISVSDDHSLVVFDKCNNKISRLTPTEFQKNPDNYFFIINKSLINRKKKYTEEYNCTSDFGWLIGAWLGDGSLTGTNIKNYNTFSLSNSSPILLEKGTKLLTKYFPNKKIKHYHHEYPEGFNTNFSRDFKCKIASHVRVSDKSFSNYLKKNFGVNSGNKILPTNILEYSDNFLKGLLAGYIDTDGTIGKSFISITSKSKELLKRFKYFLQAKYNIKCGKVYKEEKYAIDSYGQQNYDQLSTYYRIHITINKNNINFFKDVYKCMTINYKKEKILNLINKCSNKREYSIQYIPKELIIKKSLMCSEPTFYKAKKNQYITDEIKYNLPSNTDFLNDCQKNIIKKQKKKEIILIPGSYIKIIDSRETIGYDFTVDDYYTFATADGLFVYDTSATYAIHSNSALREANLDAHIKNTIFYDTNNEPLTIIRHESLFSAYVLSRYLTPKKNVNSMICNDLNDLVEEIEYYNNNLEYPVFFNNNYYPYGLCLLNKFAGFNDIIINFTVDKNSAGDLSRKIYEDSKDNEDYHRRLSDLNKKLLYLISTTSYSPSIDIHQMVNLIDDKNEKLFKKLPDKNIELGYLINEALIDRCIDDLSENSDLYLLYKSGSRFNKQQLSKTCINIGYTADADNKVIQDPIMTNLLRGMSEKDYFLGSPGTRKGKKLPMPL